MFLSTQINILVADNCHITRKTKELSEFIVHVKTTSEEVLSFMRVFFSRKPRLKNKTFKLFKNEEMLEQKL